MNIQYTHREKTVKTHNVEQMLDIAKAYLKDRYDIKAVNVSSVNRNLLDRGDLLTIEELNHYIEFIIDDTLFDNGWYLENKPSGRRS